MAHPGTGAANANGHRRREMIRRVLAEETACALCGSAVNKTLKYIPGEHGPKCPQRDCTGCAWHPKSPVVDEDIPRARGGSPLERRNCHLMCRDCNRWKSTMTLAEARAKWSGQTQTVAPIRTSFDW
jgi:5-methylcytosine-specific restriction endonuclease McrA